MSQPQVPPKKLTSSIKFLRNCFRRDIIGDRRVPMFSTFWRAVQAYAPDVEISLDTPTSSRNTTELQPAFDFVCSLLHDKPEAFSLFLANGSSPESTRVPGLFDAVTAFLRAPQPRLAPEVSCAPVCVCTAGHCGSHLSAACCC